MRYILYAMPAFTYLHRQSTIQKVFDFRTGGCVLLSLIVVNVSNTVFDVRQLSLAASVVCHVENRLCHYWLFLNLSVFNSGVIRLHAVYCASSVVLQDTLLCKRNKSRQVNLIYKCYNCYICQTVQLPSVSCNTKKNTSPSLSEM